MLLKAGEPSQPYLKEWQYDVSYRKSCIFKGSAEGLGVDDSTKEGKLLKAIIDTLGEISENLEALRITPPNSASRWMQSTRIRFP